MHTTPEPATSQPGTPEPHPRRRQLHMVVFGTDTPAGRAFDMVLIVLILFTVATLVVVVGSLTYVVEGPSNGFTSIPVSMYLTIVTLTTVGYGDIAPRTPLGQVLASMLMVLGYGIIAVPTGIVTAELTQSGRAESGAGAAGDVGVCHACGATGHARESHYCWRCGAALDH